MRKGKHNIKLQVRKGECESLGKNSRFFYF